MITNKDIRWQQRFHNFDKAFVLLRSAFDEKKLEDFSLLEQEGIIQRFEYTYELAWKTLKDYLEYSGNLNLSEITARNVFKEAFAANIISEEKVFIDMMLSRNLLSHTYDFDKIYIILHKIQNEFLISLNQLHEFFINKVINND